MTTTDETDPEYVDLDGMLDAGLTSRQLNYWATRGYLHPVDKANPGTGYPRKWPLVEYDVARLMVRLIAAGLSLDVAGPTARLSIEQRLEEVTLADGIKITVREVV